MLSGEPRLYTRFADGMIVEGGHFLLRRRSLLRAFRGRIFAVDPRTPAFQASPRMAVDPRTERIRSSYLNLAASHGEPVLTKFSRLQPVTPEDFRPPTLESTAAGVIHMEKIARPSALLPPYFALRSARDRWVKINLAFHRLTVGMAENLPVLLPIAFDHELLEDRRELDRICDIFLGPSADACAIWPVGLDETRASVGELVGLYTLLKRLPESSLLLYAGYLSMFLCLLTGRSFSNGPCFYEKRDLSIAPPLEFRPRCRYYIPELHQKLDPVTAVVFYRTLSEMGCFNSFCAACSRNMNGGNLDGIGSMPDLDIFEHNLIVKETEARSLLRSPDPIELADEDLRWVLSHTQTFSRFRSMRYIKTWTKVLQEIRTRFLE